MHAAAHNPFNIGQAKAIKTKTAKTKTGARTRVNPEDLEISDDPVPTKRQLPSQHDDIFAKMKPGQCIKVEAEYTGTVGNALRNWIRRNKKKGLTVKSVRLYPGCKEKLGRVWLIEKPKAA